MPMLTAVTTAFIATPDAPFADDARAVADERALVASAARGDVRAFESLYRRYAGRVHGVIVRRVGGHGARADDLTQEAFVRAWQALPAFRFESAFSTWLHRLAVNAALMELRSRRSRPEMTARTELFLTRRRGSDSMSGGAWCAACRVAASKCSRMMLSRTINSRTKPWPRRKLQTTSPPEGGLVRSAVK